MITVAGKRRRLRRRRRHLQQDREPARAAPRGRVAAVLPDQLRHHRQRLRAAGRRAPSSTGRSRKKWNMAGFAFAGSFFGALLFFMQGDNWQLGAFAVVMSSILGGCSLVAYYAILVDISTEDERDRASSRGWAFGYLGGGLLLADQPGDVPRPRRASGSARRWRCGSRCSRRRSGGRGSRSSRSCGCSNYAAGQRGRRDGQPAAAQLRPAVHHAERDAQLPDDADLPDRLPVLQRRHPDGDLRRVDVRREAAQVRHRAC